MVLSVASMANAAIIESTHTGNADPTTEGFDLLGDVSGAAAGGYWRVTASGKAARYGDGWANAAGADRTFTAIGYVVSTFGGANVGAAMMFEPTTDKGSGISFADDLSFIWDRSGGVTAGVPNVSYAVDGSVEHTYQLVATGGTHTAYVDGIKAFDITLPQNSLGLDPPYNPGMFVGSYSSAAGSVSDWRLWQLEDTVNIVPEPATMALLGFGGVLTLLRRRRRLA